MDAADTPFGRLVAQANVTQIDNGSIDAWLAAPGAAVLFFSGLGKGRMEAHDVAIVLSEMTKLFGFGVRIGVAMRDHEDALRERFGVRVLPSLVFLKDATVMRAISGIRDWTTYLEAFTTMFGATR